MIYLKTGIGMEPRGNDLLIASLQGNFSGGAFTRFLRVADYAVRPVEEVRREIYHFFRTHGFGKENIVFGIPRREAVLRCIDLPAEVKGDLGQVIAYQAQTFAPTDEEGYYFDYVLLEEAARSKKLTVLLVMVRKSVLDRYLSLLHGFEIEPAAMSVSSAGLANLVLMNSGETEDKISLVADFGACELDMMALRQGKLVYSRVEAKDGGRSWSDLFAGGIEDALSRMRLSSEQTVEKILITGESAGEAHREIQARFPDCERLEKTLPIQVPVENEPHLSEAAATLGLAYSGMARRPAVRMNLIPPEIRRRRQRWAYITAAVLGGVLVLLLASLGFRQMVQTRMLASMLDQEIAVLNTPVRKVQALERQSEELKRKIGQMEDLVQSRDYNLEVLHELTLILPADTFLTSYSNRSGVIQLVGLSGSSSELIPKLEKSPILRDVSQKGTIFREAQTGKDRFTIEAKLEN